MLIYVKVHVREIFRRYLSNTGIIKVHRKVMSQFSQRLSVLFFSVFRFQIDGMMTKVMPPRSHPLRHCNHGWDLLTRYVSMGNS